MGGEPAVDLHDYQVKWGPSPRGRGNRLPVPADTLVQRTIPAWAGKPNSISLSRCDTGDHPRVGGETRCARILATVSRGPSPRGRGNPRVEARMGGPSGTIPAWAGKPLTHKWLLKNDFRKIGAFRLGPQAPVSRARFHRNRASPVADNRGFVRLGRLAQLVRSKP